jgi:DNA-binding MarR family transcriptional regulator
MSDPAADGKSSGLDPGADSKGGCLDPMGTKDLPNRHIGHKFKEFSKLMDKAIYLRIIKNANVDTITAVHGWMIGYLHNNEDHEVYQKDLEKEFHMAKSSITAILQTMEKNGFIARDPVQRDARLKRIVLTEKGRQYDDQVRRSIDEVEALIRQGFTEEEVEKMMQMLNTMQERLRKEVI